MEEQIFSILRGQEYSKTRLLPSVRQWIDWKITNVLPREGGTLEQSAEFMKDFRRILSIENKYKEREEKREEMKKEIKNKGGKTNN